MMPYFSLKSLEFMNEILRYNATIQINPFGRIFVRYYSVSKDFTTKKIWKCAETFALLASYCIMGERVKIEILIFQSTLLSIVRTEIPWNCVS